MREIKFRAWDKRISQMVDVTQIAFGTPAETETLVYLQFIGLKDKSGKEIYEGDILTYGDIDDDDEIKKHEIGQIMWNSQFAEFAYFSFIGPYNVTMTEMQLMEVIGNIYENPELLRQPDSVRVEDRSRREEGREPWDVSQELPGKS